MTSILNRLQRFAEDEPMAAIGLLTGIVGLIVFSIVFIHYDQIAIEAQLPDCPFLVYDFTVNKDVCVTPADYEAFWRNECPGATATDGIFVCKKSAGQ